MSFADPPQSVPLPNVDTYCTDLPDPIEELFVKFPGGGVLTAAAGHERASAAAVSRAFFAQTQSALMPLTPLFNIMEVVGLLVKAIKAVPGILGGDVSGLTGIFPELVEKAGQLVQMLPAATVPGLVYQILTSIIVGLTGMRDELTTMVEQQKRITASNVRATNLQNQALGLAVTCAQGNLDIQVLNFNEGIKPLARLIQSVNVLLALIGVDCIAIPLDPLAGMLEEAIIVPFDEAIALVTQIRNILPTPTKPRLSPIPLSTDPC